MNENGSFPPELNGIFAEERKLIFRHLQNLRHAVDSIETHGFSALAFDEIAVAIRFINYQIHIHIENEETAVFPPMEQYLTTLLLLLKNEHKELQILSAKLMVAVHDIENGRVRGSSVRELVNNIEAIIGLIENHLEKEDASFFPFVKEFLSTEEYNRMMRTLSTINQRRNFQNSADCSPERSTIAA